MAVRNQANKTAAARKTAKPAPKHPGFRCWKISPGLREQLKLVREQQGVTVAAFYEQATEKAAEIAAKLCELGFGTESRGSAPVRVPMSDAGLARLRYASTQTGIDQSLLLAAALACMAAEPALRRGRRVKA